MMEFKIIFAFQIPQPALLAALLSPAAALTQGAQRGLLHRCSCLQELGPEASIERRLLRADRTA